MATREVAYPGTARPGWAEKRAYAEDPELYDDGDAYSTASPAPGTRRVPGGNGYVSLREKQNSLGVQKLKAITEEAKNVMAEWIESGHYYNKGAFSGGNKAYDWAACRRVAAERIGRSPPPKPEVLAARYAANKERAAIRKAEVQNLPDGAQRATGLVNAIKKFSTARVSLRGLPNQESGQKWTVPATQSIK